MSVANEWRKLAFFQEMSYATRMAKAKGEIMFVYWKGDTYETRGGGNAGYVARIYPGGRTDLGSPDVFEAQWCTK